MAVSERDRRVLIAMGLAREQHAELAELLDFYYALHEIQYEVKSELPGPEKRDEMAMRWRLEGGIPQLTFDQMRLDPATFAGLVAKVSDVLRRYYPDWDLQDDAWDHLELIDRAREVFEVWATLTSPGPDSSTCMDTESLTNLPLALAVGFGLAPYLQRAAEEILPSLDLSSWGHGYCPICGGRPNFALLDEKIGARKLMCSKCNGLWPYRRVGCPFCTTSERPSYHLSGDGLYRLYTCAGCKGYLKTVDIREARGHVEPVVERLLTVGMDLAAQQVGQSD